MQAKAIAEQMGPLNQVTGTTWLTNVYHSHPTASGAALTQLARFCVGSTDTLAIETGIATRDLSSLSMMEWMREIVQLLWPGKTPDVLYFSECQSPSEDPKAYIARKKTPCHHFKESHLYSGHL